MDKEQKQFLEITNRSGFLFQMAIEHSIRSELGNHGFDVASTEHAWIDPRTNEEGYIDIVVEANQARIVIECKRPKGGKWFFLVPASANARNPYGRLTWSARTKDKAGVLGVSDFVLLPAMYESSICIIRSEGEDERTLLERYASRLVSSVNALAFEEMKLPPSQFLPGVAYIPLIVTTATLFVATVDLTKISLEDGTIDELQYGEVPIIKFRKSLVTELSPNAMPSDIQSASEDKQRSVFVVNSKYLIEELDGMGFRSKDGMMPWQTLNQ
jgi:hypothetical protein